MAPVVKDLAKLPDADIRAMAVYLASFQDTPPDTARLEEIATTLEARTKVASAALPGARLYLGACAVCHEVGGLPLFGSRPSLALNSNLHSAAPDNLIRLILDGIARPASSDLGYMPAFKDHLGDEQLAELVAFLRKQFAPDKPAWTNIRDAIDRVGKAHSSAPP
jgi:nicotinate dehydrogenase subunit B